MGKSKSFTPRYLKNYWDFSSDLSSGRRPASKSEEKSKGIPIVLEIVWCEQLFTAETVPHLFGASLYGGDAALTANGLRGAGGRCSLSLVKRCGKPSLFWPIMFALLPASYCNLIQQNNHDASGRHGVDGMAQWQFRVSEDFLECSVDRLKCSPYSAKQRDGNQT